MINNILMIGCGKMGQAMLRGWLSRNYDDHNPINCIILKPNNNLNDIISEPNQQKYVRYIGDIEELDIIPDIIILAVKPQIIGEI